MTTETKHTPGSVAAARCIARDIIGDDTYVDEIAQIIDDKTAAPDLLEACKVALSNLDVWAEADGWDEEDAADYDIISAAIAKATGGEA